MTEDKNNKNKEVNKIQIVLEPIKLGSIQVDIIGKTPLLMDKFSEEAQNQILAKQTGVSKSNIAEEIKTKIKKVILLLTWVMNRKAMKTPNARCVLSNIFIYANFQWPINLGLVSS